MTIYASVIYPESCVETRDFLKQKRPDRVVKNPKTFISLILCMAETQAGISRGRFPGIAVSRKCAVVTACCPFILSCRFRYKPLSHVLDKSPLYERFWTFSPFPGYGPGWICQTKKPGPNIVGYFRNPAVSLRPSRLSAPSSR